MNKLKFNVAGTTYGHFDNIKDMILPSSRVQLESEPENKEDDTAVAISYMGQHIGFVPAGYTLEKAILTGKNFIVSKVDDCSLTIEEE